ncbi:DmsE family decaheme c-type cytochrome [Candidatus Aminicenantes bacterium AC-708-M15]|jgi:DmsE family decaheme c-type cytochrome|nr:DmsE family decaheme c-type cytochrome [SCandidatus Aminicenantes bacterium Aminicenantia_JdfR_composite]MCP2598602.1 DmsE family decaheme c-type cytochrome [Candidatus Aminicenantes bacterium AC-335-L06]MCP2599105.1 DmsE family decaheme c-type cytochrome [Candidatus Aminicenantes bacterium AC-335-B20]MCP2604339.1 DmsE family decaheme c-type cytochrome [Candidatus Aminicenantes bacterium AC-708-M15]
MKVNKNIIVGICIITFFVFYLLLINNTNSYAKKKSIEATYVGSETCKECHEDTFNKFKSTIHGRIADFEAKGQVLGCEACHGPGSVHVEEQDPEKIVSLKKLTPQESSKICLNCHREEPQIAWPSSTHALSGISCTDCHDPHQTRGKFLLKSKDPKLCFQCHREKIASMNYPSHHPIKEKKMKCSSCHDTHGTFRANLRAETINELCFSCHAEKQGPFTYEHAPVVENCLLCHDSHGTIANNLLKQNQPFLCMQCHPGHEDHYHPAVTNPEWRISFYTKCTQCHSQIHGSDFPSLSGHGRFTR